MALTNIYAVTNEFIRAFEQLQSMEEELTPECIQDTLGGLTHELAKDLGAALKNVAIEMAAMRDYELTMKEKRLALKRQVQKFHDYLVTNMHLCNYTKISCPEFTISLRENPEAVAIDKGAVIPQDLKRIKYEDDKIAIKKAIRNGLILDGVKLVRKKKVVIK